jgi:hypothetical protein
MHMGIDEAGRNQRLAIIMQPCLRMRRAQGRGLAQGDDPALIDQDRPMGDMPRSALALGKGVAGKGQDLSAQKIGHFALHAVRARISHGARKGIRPLPLFPRNTFR